MRFTADRRALADAAKAVAVPPGFTRPAVAGALRIDADEDGDVSFTATNIDITCVVHERGEVVAPGSVIVPARLLSGFLTAAAGSLVTMEAHDGVLTLTAGGTEANLRTLTPESWPRTRTVTTPGVEFTQGDMDVIKRVAHAAVRDSKKAFESPHLAAVNFRGSVAEASDRYRLAIGRLSCEAPAMLVPITSLDRIIAGCSDGCTVSADADMATFSTDSATWTTRLVLKEFPELERAVPAKMTKHLRFDTAELAAAVARVGLLDEGLSQIWLRPDGGKVILSNATLDVGDIADVVDCDGDFEESLLVDRKFFGDLIAAHEGESVEIGLIDRFKPMRIDSGDVTLVLIPVRPKVEK